MFLWVAEARESQWMQTRPQEWDKSETKHSVLCRTALSEACRLSSERLRADNLSAPRISSTILFSRLRQKVSVWAGQQAPSKWWCLTQRIRNFSYKRYFSSAGLEVLEHVQPMPAASFIQSNVPRSIKFLHLQTHFLNLLWRNSYPSVDWDQRTLQKSHSK